MRNVHFVHFQHSVGSDFNKWKIKILLNKERKKERKKERMNE